MKQPLKYIYHRTLVGKIVMNLYHFINKEIVPERIYLKYRYKKHFGEFPDLRSPKTLNEKIIWLKLHDRTPLHTRCADKYEVRGFIKDNIGEEYLVPLYFHTQNVNEIIADNLPDTHCIIKTNHDSGGGIFVLDKTKMNWEDIQQKLKKRMEKNYYPKSKEWQYKNITPRVIVEKLLQNSKGEIPEDYKLHCFNGSVRMIQVDMGRGTTNHYRNWYNTHWQREPYKWSSPKGPGKYTDPSPDDVPRPKTLEKMISLSEIISTHFDYVRVDWYDVDSKLYFGEVTFHHDGGNKPILPEKWDLILGSELILTKLKLQDVPKD
ncbi:glycosyl transferase [Arenibacter sp. TNZ]|uniref:ATP-grasp fold amidoligase family protein n=1 Tax=Arenibacter TaxID=178469 RepID=UPI000CD3AE6E|nr:MULTISPECIES: ATP-grasp fold amidoligase family protein [Arenibacter]MCM4172557.1 glycosyl transferase [Arenibacter sp. TNZ]